MTSSGVNLSVLIFFGQLSDAPLAEFVEFDTTRESGEVLHDREFVGPFVWGDPFADEFADFIE